MSRSRCINLILTQNIKYIDQKYLIGLIGQTLGQNKQ